ncbi:MAG: alkaline phosphatase family protein [Actinomycetaceae bacterium]|nr:alkaline phosphatase family protein [Arcanobacterium sp.]MDD7504334.1 alkaline phosphatase family protein [Actinomycetaceae bacterium]MDY6142973.1 alkaline phosphatase family protein [Arcanobacterium sp.]
MDVFYGDLSNARYYYGSGEMGASPTDGGDYMPQGMRHTVDTRHSDDGERQADVEIFSGAELPHRRNLTHVLPATLGALGMTIDNGIVSTHESNEILEIPQASSAVVIIVDGLGYEQLQARRGHVPNLRAYGIDQWITTVSPSTTAAAIASFGTGVFPGQTAMPGYSLRSTQNGKRFNLIDWRGGDIEPQAWQRVPTVFEQLAHENREWAENKHGCVLIQPKKFIGSGLTLAALRGAPSVAAQSLCERVDVTVDYLRRGARLCYLYWGDLDKTGHHHGWQSDNWVGELEEFDAGFGDLLRRVPTGTLVVLTADHGMVDASAKIDLAERNEMMKDIDFFAGEERAVHLYTREPESVAERWRNEFGDEFWIATQSDIESSGIFGHLSAQTRMVMGDIVVFARTDRGIVHSAYDSQGAMDLIGVHGSLTTAEMRIPFLVGIA